MTRKNRIKNDPLANFFSMIFNAIWRLLIFIYHLIFGKKQTQFDKLKNLQTWKEIESLLNGNDLIHAQQAVIKADKFFDNILKNFDCNNITFAQRLKKNRNKFSPEIYQQIWEAHKLRNKISHEIDHKASLNECKKAIDYYKKALFKINAI